MIEHIIRFPNGMTIKELKSLVDGLPEEDECGEPFEVWIETGINLSSPVTSVCPLNIGEYGSDLIFESDAFGE